MDALGQTNVLQHKGWIQRLENGFHAAIHTQRDGCYVTVCRSNLEIEMTIAPTHLNHTVEFLKVVVGEQSVETAILQIQCAASGLQQLDLPLQVDGMTVKGSELIAQANIEVVSQLVIAQEGPRNTTARSTRIVVLAVCSQCPLRPRREADEHKTKCK